MAKFEAALWAVLFSMALLPILAAHYAAAVDTTYPFHYIYAFGDSLTDTGNYVLYESSINVDVPPAHLPYGETYFGRPSGRVSDGRIVVDFVAKREGAPTFLRPYFGLSKSHIDVEGQSLVNFAFAGATAQNVDYLKATYNISALVPFSLGTQLKWFSTLSIYNDREALSKALIYFGEIGANDYILALRSNFSIENVILKVVPNVLETITNALEFLLQSGAKYLVIEGIGPLGCIPLFTRGSFSNATKDKYGCVEALNMLTKAHDKILKQVVQNLTTKYNENGQITFFDQLKSYANILKQPSRYGFINTTDPCFNTLQSNNLVNIKACPHPSTYVSWDGIHFTEAANNVLLNLFFTKGFVTPYPNFLT